VDWTSDLRVYDGALRWVSQLIAATPMRSLECSTPCDDFDVRALIGHLIGTAKRSLGTAQRRSTKEIPHVVVDVADADLADQYLRLSQLITAAWTATTAVTEVAAPWGPCPAQDAVRGFTIETLVHGWDLAVATDRPAEAPEGLAAAVLPHVDSVIPAGTRARMYAAVVTSAEDADATEQLAALLGRRR
jgi:uncharacterized protein (TIGR03086 family)